MRDNASLIGFWIVGGEWIVEECQHACCEGEAYEKGGGEGKWKSMHEKEQGSSARYHRGRTLSTNTMLAGLKQVVNFIKVKTQHELSQKNWPHSS